MLPQVLLTVLVVLSSQSFGNVYYYGLAVAGLCLCQVLNVLKAMSIYSSKAEHTAAGVAVTSAALLDVDSTPVGTSSIKQPAAGMTISLQAHSA